MKHGLGCACLAQAENVNLETPLYLYASPNSFCPLQCFIIKLERVGGREWAGVEKKDDTSRVSQLVNHLLCLWQPTWQAEKKYK